ncbi:MAG: AAA family ATPase [Christensenellaceae bacterium]|jgi:chromosome segregation protein|nr:AAA family ATPase [Christensenellaceae bacterium]
MVFKRIEMQGFKSFADKLEVDFSSGITCIVGPNGCGKSNVSDAVRWVLGEQSSKALRGTNMQDVIFKGTEKRKSLSFCEVSLVFDNTNKVFPIEYSEVVLSRKLYRSGESEYLINRNPARLKDINELLHDSGIDRDGLTIIGQGQVLQLMNAKPEERRGVFEEAAGISKFKVKKDEAERKLEKTQIELTRVNDVVVEIERNLEPLMKQAEVAQRYIALRDRLKYLEINNFIYKYDGVASIKSEISAKVKALGESLQNLQDELSAVQAETQGGIQELSNLDVKAEELRKQVLMLSVALERQSAEKRLVQEKMEIVGAREGDIQTDIARLEVSLNEAKEDKEKYLKNQNKIKQEIENIKTEIASLEEKQRNQNFKEIELKKIDAEINRAELLKAQITARQKTIQNIIESGEGYKFSVKKVLEERKRNSKIADAVVGVVAQEIKVPTEYESAIEVALGAVAQNIITRNEDDAKMLIAMLAQNNAGRATFLPISSVKGRTLDFNERSYLNSYRGVIGIASEIVSYDPYIKQVVESMLGRVVVCQTLDDAINLAKGTRYGFKIVTLDGDVIETRGSITGGSKNALGNNLWHTKQLEELAKNLETADAEIARLEREKKRFEMGDNELADSLIEEITELKIAQTRSESDIAFYDENIKRITNEIFVFERDIADKKATQKGLNRSIQPNPTEKVQNAYSQAELDYANGQLQTLDSKKVALHSKIAELDSKKNNILTQIGQTQSEYFKQETSLSRIDEDIETLTNRIFEEYGLNYSGCYAFRDANFDAGAAAREIGEIKRAVSKLGNVNVDAIEQSKEYKERYDSYREQSDDLLNAKLDLEKVIAELSREMEIKFRTDFIKINENFGQVFKELFKGGNAKLVLIDPDDYLNSGIDIIAEPPGKKLQSIALLSGGEKAMTAIAILFAILKLRPMPFCLLDEIEAALDDANVARFANYLKNFSKNTQFIVITHRKPTMELADNLYGVTMEEKGVSKLVSVQLESWTA